MIVTTCPECKLTLTEDTEKCPKCSTLLPIEETKVTLLAEEKPKTTRTRKKVVKVVTEPDTEEKTTTNATKKVTVAAKVAKEETETKSTRVTKKTAATTKEEDVVKKAAPLKKVTIKKNVDKKALIENEPVEMSLAKMSPEEILEDIIETAEKENICETCFAPVEEGQNFCQLCGSNVQSMREQVAPVLPKTDKEANKWIAALGYFFFFFPIICGYYRKSKFAKFHAKQSLLLFVSSVAFFTFLVIFRNIIVSLISPTLTLEMLSPNGINGRFFATHGFGFIFYYYLYGMVNLMHLLPFALMIVGIINALQGKKKPLPLIGRLMKFTRENLNFIKKPAEKK